MEKKTTIQKLDKVLNSINEEKEAVLLIHIDWETELISFGACGDETNLSALVASAMEENPKENSVVMSLLGGFAVANYMQKGKLVETIKKMSKHIEESEKKNTSVVVHRGNESDEEKEAESLMVQMIAELKKGGDVEKVVDKYIKCASPEYRQKVIDGINNIRNRFTLGSNHQ